MGIRWQSTGLERWRTKEAKSDVKEKAAAELKKAQEEGDVEKQDQMSKRTVRVTKEHNEDIKKLLRLMGCPVIEAPMEAEAQ